MTTRRFHPLIEQRLSALGAPTRRCDVDLATMQQALEPFGPPEDWDLDIHETTTPGPNGVPVRLYRTTKHVERPMPALLWLHGGGFWGGYLDMPEGHEVARGVAGRSGALVVSADYRLCEAPAGWGPGEGAAGTHFPAPVDDVVTVYDWIQGHADHLGIDPRRIAIGGASAGGCLAAAATLRLVRRGTPPWQVLLMYPTLHPTLPEASPELRDALLRMPKVLGFPPKTMTAMNGNYFGASLDHATADAFPGIATDLEDFPPTLIDSCEFDDLRSSSEDFADRLRHAGVAVEQVTSPGVSHGHLSLIGMPVAHASLDRMAARLR